MISNTIIIYEIHQRAEELQYRVQDLEEYIDYMEDVKEQLEKNVKAAGFVPEERNGYFKVP